MIGMVLDDTAYFMSLFVRARSNQSQAWLCLLLLTLLICHMYVVYGVCTHLFHMML